MSQIGIAHQFFQLIRVVEKRADLFRLMEEITLEIGFRHFALIHHADFKNSTRNLIQMPRPSSVGASPNSKPSYFRNSRLRIVARNQGIYGRGHSSLSFSDIADGLAMSGIGILAECRRDDDRRLPDRHRRGNPSVAPDHGNLRAIGNRRVF